ncbi:MAG: hypothetical protein NC293_04210 [Roseburia sp.]|nr:hypothetical protein [Roseburia sp.]
MGCEFNSKPYQLHAAGEPWRPYAYKTALWTYGESALKALQLRPIPPDEVNLTPELIRYNR